MRMIWSQWRRGEVIRAAGLLLLLGMGIGPMHAAGFMHVAGADKPNAAAGAKLFHERGCEHCHGVEGVGGGNGPDLSGIGRRWKPDEIEAQVLHGGGGMPAFGEVLLPDETAAVVEYLRHKRAKERKVKGAKVVPGAPVAPVAKPESE